jgi:hypothetical protein
MSAHNDDGFSSLSLECLFTSEQSIPFSPESWQFMVSYKSHILKNMGGGIRNLMTGILIPNLFSIYIPHSIKCALYAGVLWKEFLIIYFSFCDECAYFQVSCESSADWLVASISLYVGAE